MTLYTIRLVYVINLKKFNFQKKSTSQLNLKKTNIYSKTYINVYLFVKLYKYI